MKRKKKVDFDKIQKKVYERWEQQMKEIYPLIKDLPLAPKPKMKREKRKKRFVELEEEQ